MATIAAGWETTFVGKYDELFVEAIRDMHAKSISDITKVYTNHVALIQSSGSGKSRIVREAGKHIFTIPINLRDPKDTKNGEFSDLWK